MIDTHCHLDSERYENVDEVIKNAIKEGITRMVVPALSRESCENVKKLAEKYDIITPAHGIHPEEGKDEDLDSLAEFLRPLLKGGILGEVGIDYYHESCPAEKQASLLELQLQIAQELRLPVIIHSRKAYEDTKNIVKNFDLEKVVFHCFPYGKKEAKELLDLGYFLSFTGVITFKNAHETRETAAYVPMDRLMAETDSPYLTPVPFRGKTNYPHYVKYVIETLGDIHYLDYKAAEAVLNHTANQFFNI